MQKCASDLCSVFINCYEESLFCKEHKCSLANCNSRKAYLKQTKNGLQFANIYGHPEEDAILAPYCHHHLCPARDCLEARKGGDQYCKKHKPFTPFSQLD